jgi:cytochrome c
MRPFRAALQGASSFHFLVLGNKKWDKSSSAAGERDPLIRGGVMKPTTSPADRSLRSALATLAGAALLAAAPASLAQDQPPTPPTATPPTTAAPTTAAPAAPTTPSTATAPAAAAATPPAAAQDCMACHGMAKDAPPSIGPNLWGVMGRKAGSTAYAYSPAMTAYGQTWGPENLQAFIQSPATVVPGTAMAYTGVPDPAQAKAVVDYLATLHD